MSEEKKETTDDGQPTTDDNLLNKEHSVDNENKNEKYSSEKRIEKTDEPITHNSQLTTPDMEVHHHTHASHGKKNWKNYFWEFLMLFLAVFCGFLAEYQLEHVIEHQREKEFIKSMVEDLHDDHEKLNSYITNVQFGIRQMDTLITILDSNELIKQNGNQLYYLGRVSPRVNNFTTNNRTIEQLKNSGSFRLIKNPSASNKIMAYYNSFAFIKFLQDLYFQEFEEYKRNAAKVFDPAVFRSMEMAGGEISREANNPSLKTNNPELLNQLAMYAVYMNGSRRSIIPAAESLQKEAETLSEYLKKEYHLE